MANNTELNPGVGGDEIDTDDMGAFKTQAVKIRLGATGVDDGLLDQQNPMPSDLAEVGGNSTQVGPGTAAGSLRVELPTDGQGLVFVKKKPIPNSPSGTTTVPFTEVSTEIHAATPTRTSILLYNDGDSDILVSCGEDADATKQKLIAGNYLSFEGSGVVNGWNAIANGADVDVRWTDESYSRGQRVFRLLRPQTRL